MDEKMQGNGLPSCPMSSATEPNLFVNESEFEPCEYSIVPAPNTENRSVIKTLNEAIESSNCSSNVVAECSIDNVKPLEPQSFPNPPKGGNFVPATIPNVHHLVKSYGISARYDVIKKKLKIVIAGLSGSPDNLDNVAMSHIISLASLNGINTGLVTGFVEAVADRYQLNPVADWITSKPWDGNDRLQPLCDALVQREEFPEPLKCLILRKWLISAVAAALEPNGSRVRGVLTLQGPQSIGKTEFVKSLVSDSILRDQVVKLDHHLDPGNKDSFISAICHWIVEIGELDSSFKKDIARLKGFLTSAQDKVRRPYAKTESEYPRRTVFCATVNEHNFLVDPTGNTRWWTIPVVKINFNHGIDMQQLFAQIKLDYDKHEEWWLSPAEEELLEKHNREHRAVSIVRERISDALDTSRLKDSELPAMSASEVLIEIGIKNPTNIQSKECASVLKELLGLPKRIRGSNKWRVPLKTIDILPKVPEADDDDRY